MIVAAIVGVLLPAVAAAAGRLSVRITGASAERVANVEFLKTDASGCVETDLYQTASTAQQTVVTNDGITKYGIRMTASIAIFDVCNGVGISFFACDTASATVNIDPSLNSASLAGTLTCTNADTNETCQLTKSETLTGTGPTTTGIHHLQIRDGGLLINAGGRNTTRDATVTSASVTGCGFSFTQTDATVARLLSDSGSSTVIQRV